VLAIGEARFLLASSLLGRLPLAMSPLAILLAVREATGSFEAAGIAAGAFAACNAAAAPVVGRMVDRIGQRPVLLGAAAGQGIALVALAFLASDGAGAVALVAVSAVAGLLVPPTSACARALWPHVARTASQRETAYALEAVSQEVAFTSGPLNVAAGIALGSESTALLLAAACSVVGNGLFAATTLAGGQRGDREPAHHGGVLSQPRLRMVLISVSFVGIAFGGIQVGVAALAVNLHESEAAGVLLALTGLGSLIGGLAYGARAWRGSIDRRYVLCLLGAGISAVPLLLAGSLELAIVLAVVSGVAYAPALSCHYALVQGLAPRQAITEAFTWSNASLISGSALGSALAGWLVETWSEDAAFLLIVVSMGLGALVAMTPRVASPGTLAPEGQAS
jgi:MFS family permease